MNTNEILREIIRNSGKTSYRISKESGVAESTFSMWLNDNRIPNASLIKVIYAASKDDEDFLKNIKKFVK